MVRKQCTGRFPEFGDENSRRSERARLFFPSFAFPLLGELAFKNRWVPKAEWISERCVRLFAPIFRRAINATKKWQERTSISHYHYSYLFSNRLESENKRERKQSRRNTHLVPLFFLRFLRKAINLHYRARVGWPNKHRMANLHPDLLHLIIEFKVLLKWWQISSREEASFTVWQNVLRAPTKICRTKLWSSILLTLGERLKDINAMLCVPCFVTRSGVRFGHICIGNRVEKPLSSNAYRLGA